MTRGAWTAAAISAAAAAALHAVTLSYGFVVDDLHQIVGNRWIESGSGLAEAFTRGVWDFEGRASSYYRPAMYAVYAAVRQIAGPGAWGFHLANLVLHTGAAAIAALLVAALVDRDGAARPDGPRWAALGAGLLFAVHPVHTEAVAWCAGVVDVGMGLFYLATVLGYVVSKDRFSPAWLIALVSFAMALLFKEPAATLPVALVAYDALYRRGDRGWRLTLLRVAPFLGVLALYLGARALALGGVAPTVREVGLGAGTHVLTVLDLLARYVGKLVLPVGLAFWQPYEPPASILTGRGVLAIATLVALALVAAWAWRRRPTPLFGIVLIVLPLLPVLAIGALNQGLSGAFAERYLYLPSFGFVLVVATGLGRPSDAPFRRHAAMAAVLGLASLYAVGTATRLPVWRDSLSLWTDAARRSPDSAIARSNLGFALLGAGQAERGREELARAMALDPGIADEWIAKGIGYARHGLTGRAMLAFHTALALDTRRSDAWFNLGVLHEGRQERDQAVAAYRRALDLDPRQPGIRNNLGVLFAEEGRFAEAIAVLEEAARLAPGDPEIRANLRRAQSAVEAGSWPEGR